MNRLKCKLERGIHKKQNTEITENRKLMKKKHTVGECIGSYTFCGGC